MPALAPPSEGPRGPPPRFLSTYLSWTFDVHGIITRVSFRDRLRSLSRVVAVPVLCSAVPRPAHLFSRWWVSGLFPLSGCHASCRSERLHTGLCVDTISCLLGWCLGVNCWVLAALPAATFPHGLTSSSTSRYFDSSTLSPQSSSEHTFFPSNVTGSH